MLATVGASMVALLLIAALVIDLGVSWMLVRHAQNAADSSALAAARWVPDYIGPPVDPTYGPRGPVPGPAGYMWQEACASARANGFFRDAVDNGTTETGGCVPANDGDRAATLTVNYPPAVAGSGEFSGRPGFVQVIIAARHESFFGRLVGSAWANVSASAVVANKTCPKNPLTGEPECPNAYSLVALNPGAGACGSGTIRGNAHGASVPETPDPYFGVGGLVPGASAGPGMLTSMAYPGAAPPAYFAAPPRVNTFTVTSPASLLTSGTSITYSLVFDQTVSGLAASDFSVLGSATGWSVSSVAGSGASYVITVLGGGVGTVQLRLNSGTVTNGGGQSGPSSSQTAPTVTIDRTAPSLSTFAPTSPTTTGSSTITYTLTFNESVTRPLGANFAISGTSTGWSLSTILPNPGPASTYTVTLSGSTPTDGTVILNFLPAGITDVAGNALASGGSNSNVTYASPAVPQVTSLTGPSPWSNTTITYALTFKSPVTGLAVGDFSINSASTSLGWGVDSVSGSGSSYTVTLSVIDPSLNPLVNGDTLILILGANTVNSSVSPFNVGPAAAYTAPTVTIYVEAPKVWVGGAVFINSGCSSGPVDDACTQGGIGALTVSNNSGLRADGGVWIAGTCEADPSSVSCPGAANTNCPHEGATQLGDPLAQLGAPRMPATGKCDVGKPANARCNFSGGKTYITSPGFFPGGWDIKGKGTIVNMEPGIYYIGGGGITQKSGTTVNTIAANGQPAGVLMFSTDNPAYRLGCIAGTTTGTNCQDWVSLKGTVNIDPIGKLNTDPKNKPYRGLLIWQDKNGSCPTAANCGSVTLSAGGSTARGTIYLPRWQFTMAGSATGGQYPIQVIAWSFVFTGGSTIRLEYDGTTLWNVDERGLVH